jgi:hypothetical protein
VSISMRPAAFERLGEVRRQKLKLGMVVATIGVDSTPVSMESKPGMTNVHFWVSPN